MIVVFPDEDGIAIKYEVILTKCIGRIDDCSYREHDRVLKRGEVRDYYIVFKKICDGDFGIENVEVRLKNGDVIEGYYSGAVVQEGDIWYFKFTIDTNNLSKDVFKLEVDVIIKDYIYIYDGFIIIKDGYYSLENK